MKRIRQSGRIRVFLFLLVFLLSCLALGPALSDGNALTVSVPVDRCPVFYRDADTGEIAGIGADLLRVAAENAGYDVTFTAIKEKNLTEAIGSDAYDLVLPFGSTAADAPGQTAIVVSDNLILTPFTLLTLDSQDLPSRSGLRIGMMSSMSGVADVVQRMYPDFTVTLYGSMAECVEALRGGEADALLHNSFVWSYILQKPAYEHLKPQPSSMFSMDFRAAAQDTPEGREIIERLNGGIAAITDAQRQAYILDYTTRRLYRYDLSDYLYQYSTIILLCFCLITAVVMIVIERQHVTRLENEEKMRQLIDRDPLTGAWSLAGFRKQVDELLRTRPDIPYVIAYANIRNFKYINDSLGMEAGSELLRFWVSRTQEALSGEEAVCRIEADHVAVLARVDSEDKLAWYEQSVINPVRNYFTDRGKEYRVQVCCGVYVLSPADYRTINVDHMLDLARVAEKKVRETRKDGYEFYNPEQWQRGKQIAEVVNHLPAAIRSGDIHVWYQPQVNGKTGEITGAEALCRWDHEKLGWLYPPMFIDTLEESGIIYDLDTYIWDRVCQDLRRWNEQGIRRSVSVNLSRRDIRKDRDIPGHFTGLVKAYGLTPDQLRIEITETAFVENPDDLIRTTEKLQEAGFEVEMDDFGSGNSSLHMLKEVPVNRIKLDLHFLTSSGDPEKGRVILRHVVGMINALGMRMIAEGVETEEQAAFLRGIGCTEMQGYLFHKPMPVEQFEKLDTQK